MRSKAWTRPASWWHSPAWNARRGAAHSPRLAAVLARLGNPGEAWQCLEEDLGRGLLDELFGARTGGFRLASARVSVN